MLKYIEDNYILQNIVYIYLVFLYKVVYFIKKKDYVKFDYEHNIYYFLFFRIKISINDFKDSNFDKKKL